MVSSRRSPGSEHGVGVMLDVGCSRITSWTLLASRPFLLLLFSLLFSYVSHHICLALAAAPPHYLTLPISLNSLDLAGVRLLSPCDSQILPNSCRWGNRVQVGPRWRLWSLFYVFSSWSVVVPSWDDRGSSIRGGLSLFWFRSRSLIVFWMMYGLFMYCVKWRL